MGICCAGSHCDREQERCRKRNSFGTERTSERHCACGQGNTPSLSWRLDEPPQSPLEGSPRSAGTVLADAEEKVGVVQPEPGNSPGTLSNFWSHPPLPTTGAGVSTFPHKLSTEAVTENGDKWAISGKTVTGYSRRLALTLATRSGTSPGRAERHPVLRGAPSNSGRWLAGARIMTICKKRSRSRLQNVSLALLGHRAFELRMLAKGHAHARDTARQPPNRGEAIL